ncbi:hypothetical protein JHK84_049325 [Glycine max]|nr:hypothetical protein JHK86_049285 [Glycine max]KAG5093737.1 hypothetical protein JHK84_049325 [Glycine max]
MNELETIFNRFDANDDGKISVDELDSVLRLIFNTNSNQTVVQTYDKMTYLNCIADYSDNGTFVYNGESRGFGEALVVVVPLTIVGPNYFFFDADNGVQCQHNLAFEIDVQHGLGLPPSLNQPPLPSY